MADTPKRSDADQRSISHRPTTVTAPSSSRWLRWLLAILVLFLITAALIVTAQKLASPPVSRANPNDIITRIYDVRDLIVGVPNFAPPGATRPAADIYPRTRRQHVDDLIAKLTSSIDPPSWQSGAGSTGTIHEAAGQLTITQSRLNHERVHKKLEELRGGAQHMQVTVEMRIVAPPPPGQLVPTPQLQWISSNQGQTALWPVFLDDAGRNMLIRAVNPSTNSVVITAPRLNLVDGQRSYVLVSRHTAYISRFAKVPATTTQPATFAPKTDVADTGILFDCQATLSDDQKSVTLALRPKLTTLIDITTALWRSAPPGRTDLIVQVPHIRETSLDTTITMPTDMTAVYRVRSSQIPPATRPSEEPVSLLLITPHVLIQAPSHNPATSQSAAAK